MAPLSSSTSLPTLAVTTSPVSPFKRWVLWLTLTAFVGQPLAAAAQVVAAGSTPGTRVGAAQNGVPVVQIATPSGAGVSHNQYQQFNVDQRGVVLNNSRTLTQTQQAGWIEGNANLNNGTARIILNEVTSNLPSSLNGYTEVAGQKAEVVIANPNGITCDGCGFINTSRGVLTTGTPVFGGSGSLDAFRVSGGNITLQGNGLNGSNLDQLDLIARSVQVNANLWAQNLNVITGPNRVDYASLGVQLIPGQTGQPTVGIDVAALGGMYANKIRLVGTEAGVGVNVAGTLAAQAGDLQLSTNGQLTISGTVSSAGNIVMQAATGISNRGNVVAQGDAEISTAGDLSNAAGIITSGTRLSLSSTGTLNNQSGLILSSGPTTIDAAQLINGGGQISVSGSSDLKIATTGIADNTSGKIQSQGALSINSASLVNSSGNISAAGLLALSNIGGLNNRNGIISTSADGELLATSLSNEAGLIQAGNDLSLSLSQWLGGGQANSGRDLYLIAGDNYRQAASSTITANRDFYLQSSGKVGNEGDFSAVGNFFANVGGFINGASGRVTAKSAAFQVANDWVNQGNVAASNLTVQAGTFDNSGTVTISGDTNLQVGQLTNRVGGTLDSSGNLSAKVSGDVVNGGELFGNSLILNGANITNQGLIGANNDLNFSTPGAVKNTANATLYAGNDLGVGADVVSNGEDGLIWAGRNLSITGTDGLHRATSIENNMGRLEANTGNLLLKAETVRNVGQAPDVDKVAFSDSPGPGYLNGCYSLPKFSFPGLSACNWNEQTQAIDTAWGVPGINKESFQAFLDRNPALKSPSLHDWLYVMPVGDYSREDTGHEMRERGDRFWVDGWIEVAKSNSSVKNANIISGNNLQVDAGVLRNEFGVISSDADMSLTGTTLENVGKVLQKETVITQHFMSWSGVPSFTRSLSLYEDVDEIPAVIHAGGTLSISMSGSVVNNSQAGASHVLEGQSRNPIFSGVGPAAIKSISFSLPNGIVLTPNGTMDFSGSTLPNNGGSFTSLFGRASPSQNYLIETNPRFANYKNFISSDYMLNQLGLSPSDTLKRLGDGYYESQLVNAQVKSKTGQTTLAGYANANAQYSALLTAGAAEAKDFNLTVGVKLTAEQVSKLTQNIVWLEETQVGGQSVLVPVVYLVADASPSGSYDATRQGRGATLSGSNLVIATEGTGPAVISNSGAMIGSQALTISGTNITNSGKLATGNSGVLTVTAVNNLSNIGGHILGGEVSLSAKNDLVSSADKTSIDNHYSFGTLSGQVAGASGEIQSAGNLTLLAGQDLSLTGTGIAAGKNATLAAGRDLVIQASESSTRSISSGGNSHSDSTEVSHQGTSVVAGGNVQLVSNRDITVFGSSVSGASITASAGRDLTIAAVTDRRKGQVSGRSGSNKYNDTNLDESVQGTSLNASGALTLVAQNNVTVTSSSLSSSNGAIGVQAGNALTIGGLEEVHSRTHDNKSKGFLSSGKDHDAVYDAEYRGSSVSGNTVTLTSGTDLKVAGSQIVGTQDVGLYAGKGLLVTSGQDYHSEQHEKSKSDFGVFSSGGTGIFIGSRKLEQDSAGNQVTQVGSTIGSLTGNVTLAANRKANIVASQVLAPQGDVTVDAQQVAIQSGTNTSHYEQHTRFSQTGVTVAVSNPLVSLAQMAQQMADASTKTTDPRMLALAAATTGLAAKNTYDTVKAGQGTTIGGKEGQILTGTGADGKPTSRDATAMDKVGGINVSVSVGSSSSKSDSRQDSQTAVGSTLAAGHDLTIRAHGAGADSNLVVEGSNLSGGNNVILAADNAVKLVAAQNTDSTRSSSSSSSGSLGVGYNTSSGFSIQASANNSKGKSNGDDLTWSNTEIQAGQKLTLKSGGDTTLQGAVAQGGQVVAQVGGNLNIASLQDTSTYDSHFNSNGFSISVPLGAGGLSGSVSASNRNVNSDYRSVTEQSGLKAGDSGFQVAVAGDTTLQGGAILSTQKAVEDGANQFSTGGTLSVQDLKNKADYQGNAKGVNIGAGVNQKGAWTPSGSMAGVGSESGSASSTTQAAISGIAGNKNARTGDKETGIGKIFDAKKVEDSLDAQVQITQEFGYQAGQAVETYVTTKRKALQEKLGEAQTKEEKELLQKELSDLRKQEQALNILIGAISGKGGMAVTKEVVSEVAEKMRDFMIKDSKKFPGVVDNEGKTITNIGGPSEGVRYDGKKIGGVRIDLDLLCGTGNERCIFPRNEDGTVDTTKPVKFTGGLNPDGTPKNQTLDAFIATPEGQRMLGITGGLQGIKGTLFGRPYEAGSWQDKLVEAFGGSHDLIGGKWSGLYDEQGNIKRGMSKTERAFYDDVVTVGAIPLAAPFAASEGLSPEAWNALGILLRAVK